MSSQFGPHAATFCIDNLPGTFCHSGADTSSPWLSISFSASVDINYVLVYNRADCCQDRINKFQLWVGTSNGDYNSATSNSCGVDAVDLEVPDSAGTGPFSFRCLDSFGSPHSGTHLTLVLPGASRTLNIGELEAYGPPPSPSPPLG